MSDHNAGDASFDERLGTGRRLTVMSARLQSHVSSGSLSLRASVIKGLRFCMRSPAVSRAPTANDPPVFDDDTAHSRVRPDSPKPAPRKRERVAHVGFVVLAHSSLLGGRSSLTNLSKSSAAWKFL